MEELSQSIGTMQLCHARTSVLISPSSPAESNAFEQSELLPSSAVRHQVGNNDDPQFNSNIDYNVPTLALNASNIIHPGGIGLGRSPSQYVRGRGGTHNLSFGHLNNVQRFTGPGQNEIIPLYDCGINVNNSYNYGPTNNCNFYSSNEPYEHQFIGDEFNTNYSEGFYPTTGQGNNVISVNSGYDWNENVSRENVVIHYQPGLQNFRNDYMTNLNNIQPDYNPTFGISQSFRTLYPEHLVSSQLYISNEYFVTVWKDCYGKFVHFFQSNQSNNSTRYLMPLCAGACWLYDATQNQYILHDEQLRSDLEYDYFHEYLLNENSINRYASDANNYDSTYNLQNPNFDVSSYVNEVLQLERLGVGRNHSFEMNPEGVFRETGQPLACSMYIKPIDVACDILNWCKVKKPVPRVIEEPIVDAINLSVNQSRVPSNFIPIERENAFKRVRPRRNSSHSAELNDGRVSASSPSSSEMFYDVFTEEITPPDMNILNQFEVLSSKKIALRKVALKYRKELSYPQGLPRECIDEDIDTDDIDDVLLMEIKKISKAFIIITKVRNKFDKLFSILPSLWRDLFILSNRDLTDSTPFLLHFLYSTKLKLHKVENRISPFSTFVEYHMEVLGFLDISCPFENLIDFTLRLESFIMNICNEIDFVCFRDFQSVLEFQSTLKEWTSYKIASGYAMAVDKWCDRLEIHFNTFHKKHSYSDIAEVLMKYNKDIL